MGIKEYLDDKMAEAKAKVKMREYLRNDKPHYFFTISDDEVQFQELPTLFEKIKSEVIAGDSSGITDIVVLIENKSPLVQETVLSRFKSFAEDLSYEIKTVPDFELFFADSDNYLETLNEYYNAKMQ